MPPVFNGARFAKSAAREKVPLGPLYLFAAVAAIFRFVEHRNFYPACLVANKEGVTTKGIICEIFL